MSMSPHEAEMEEAYDRLAEELYGEHKDRAIEEFTSERLRSFYVANSMVMRPAVEAIQEGKRLQSNDHHSAALVFYVTAIELLLKATLLRPVLYGLIHAEAIAEIFVQETLKQSGFDRYEKLLASLFEDLTGESLSDVTRDGAQQSIFRECRDVQRLRNGVIHRGENVSPESAEIARLVAISVFEKVVHPVLYNIGLQVVEKGEIVAT